MSAQATLEERSGERRRAEALLGRQGISRQQYDQQVAAEHTAQAAVASARAQIDSLEVQLGEEGEANLRLRQSRRANIMACKNSITLVSPFSYWRSLPLAC